MFILGTQYILVLPLGCVEMRKERKEKLEAMWGWVAQQGEGQVSDKPQNLPQNFPQTSTSILPVINDHLRQEDHLMKLPCM